MMLDLANCNSFMIIGLLSPQNILKAFQNSGASMGQIKEIGMWLNIPRDQMIVNQDTTPPRLAVDIIEKWKEQDPQTTDLDYAYNKLSNILRQCKLSCIIHRLTHTRNTCKWNGECVYMCTCLTEAVYLNYLCNIISTVSAITRSKLLTLIYMYSRRLP